MGASRWRCALQRLAAAALGLALHAALLLVPTPSALRRMAPASGGRVPVLVLLRAAVPPPRPRPRNAGRSADSRAGLKPAPRVALSLPARTLRHRVRPVRPPARWFSVLRQVARRMSSRGASARVRLGFPRSRAFGSARRAQPWDGWDYAATHRIEALPQGGTVIALDDRCSLVLAPIPIVGCWLGHLPASGGLFRHMRLRPVGALP